MKEAGMIDEFGMPASRRGEIVVSDGVHGEPANLAGRSVEERLTPGHCTR
jgi:hypothetical protein